MATSVFDTPVEQLKLYVKGDPLTAKRLNEPLTALNKLMRGTNPPKQNFPRKAAAQSAVTQYRYKSMAGDYIVCKTWDGVDEGTDSVTIAKPYLLRRTPFDGETRNDITYAYTSDFERTATNVDEDEEEQVIVPSYVVDDLIYATGGIVGGTDVFDANDEAVTILDDNRDARAWARKAAE